MAKNDINKEEKEAYDIKKIESLNRV